MPTITPTFHCGVVGAFQQEFLRKAFNDINKIMTKSCIKIKPITSNSEVHNFREIEPKYLIEKSNDNVSVELIKGKSLEQYREEIENRYVDKVGQKMQKKSTPLREGVILLKDDNNERNLKNLVELSERLKEDYNIKTLQIHIHNDEGHIRENNSKSYNYHAHMVFDWTDHSTGKSLKIDKEQMSEIQTLTAEYLGMERGEKGSKNLSLSHQEYRGFLEIKDKLEKELKQELNAKQEIRIREELVKKREQEKKIELTEEKILENGKQQQSKGQQFKL